MSHGFEHGRDDLVVSSALSGFLVHSSCSLAPSSLFRTPKELRALTAGFAHWLTAAVGQTITVPQR